MGWPAQHYALAWQLAFLSATFLSLCYEMAAFVSLRHFCFSARPSHVALPNRVPWHGLVSGNLHRRWNIRQTKAPCCPSFGPSTCAEEDSNVNLEDVEIGQVDRDGTINNLSRGVVSWFLFDPWWVCQADVTDPSSLVAALTGVSAVVFAARASQREQVG